MNNQQSATVMQLSYQKLTSLLFRTTSLFIIIIIIIIIIYCKKQVTNVHA